MEMFFLCMCATTEFELAAQLYFVSRLVCLEFSFVLPSYPSFAIPKIEYAGYWSFSSAEHTNVSLAICFVSENS